MSTKNLKDEISHLTQLEQELLTNAPIYNQSSMWIPFVAGLSIAAGIGTTKLLNRMTRSSSISKTQTNLVKNI